MDVLNAIIALISGAVGGNIAGASMPQKNLGAIVNTVAGLIGGGLGQFIMKAFGIFSAATGAGATGHELDIAQLLSSIGVGGVTGGVLTAIITAIKNAMRNP